MSDHLLEGFRPRSFKFSLRLFDFCEDLASQPGMRRRIAYQLWDAGSSIGANLEEAKAAYSRRELAAKTADSLQESREAKYWLRIAKAKLLGKHSECDWLLDEADQFVAMLTVSVRKLQAETKKPPKPAKPPTGNPQIEKLESKPGPVNNPAAEN